MIALPEVETIRRDLDREVSGKRIKAVEVLHAAAGSRSGTRKKIADRLEKQKITAVRRHGLYLTLGLDGGDVVVFDLGATGRLLRAANKDEVSDDTLVVITFTQQGQLRLLDRDQNAQMIVAAADDLPEEVPELDKIGVDPIEVPMSWTTFGELLMRHDTTLRSLLTDDTIIVGLGDLYTDEILFQAGLRYDRRTASLSTQEIRRLYRSLVETLHDAVKHRGTTLEDDSYRDLFGEPGGFQEHLAVHGKAGELSPRSRRPIVRSKVGGRWTYYCEQSQV